MKVSWLDARKNSAKTVAAVKAEECKPNNHVRCTI